MSRHQATVPLLAEDAFDVEDPGSTAECLDEHYANPKDGDEDMAYIRARHISKTPASKMLLYVAVGIGMGAVFCTIYFAMPLMKSMIRPEDNNVPAVTFTSTQTCSQCVYNGEYDHSEDDIEKTLTDDQATFQRCFEACKELALATDDTTDEADSEKGSDPDYDYDEDSFNMTKWLDEKYGDHDYDYNDEDGVNINITKWLDDEDDDDDDDDDDDADYDDEDGALDYDYDDEGFNITKWFDYDDNDDDDGDDDDGDNDGDNDGDDGDDDGDDDDDDDYEDSVEDGDLDYDYNDEGFNITEWLNDDDDSAEDLGSGLLPDKLFGGSNEDETSDEKDNDSKEEEDSVSNETQTPEDNVIAKTSTFNMTITDTKANLDKIYGVSESSNDQTSKATNNNDTINMTFTETKDDQSTSVTESSIIDDDFSELFSDMKGFDDDDSSDEDRDDYDYYPTDEEVIEDTWRDINEENVMEGYEDVMADEANFKKQLEEEGVFVSDEKVHEFLKSHNDNLKEDSEER